jgi:hypothetical protein
MTKEKCNCGKKATSEYLIKDKKAAWTVKFCNECKPKRDNKNIYRIDK